MKVYQPPTPPLKLPASHRPARTLNNVDFASTLPRMSLSINFLCHLPTGQRASPAFRSAGETVQAT